MRFSQRKGLRPVRTTLQREEVDQALRNKLWSALHLTVFQASRELSSHGTDPDTVAARLWLHFFREPLDRQPSYGLPGLEEYARNWFMQAQWFEIYDLIEAIAVELDGKPKRDLTELINSFLEGEQSAYRLVGTSVAEITSEEELAAIEAALVDASVLPAVRTHVASALEKLSDRKRPDYRNAIKEAISGVEAMCQSITQDRRATLGQALKRLRDAGIDLHPSLEQAWLKLYGYTSDAGGIRHALADEVTVTHAQAKYMVVTCSAFVSHLVELAATAQVPLKPPA